MRFCEYSLISRKSHTQKWSTSMRCSNILELSRVHRESAMNSNKLAAACAGVLFAYYEIYRWVPLGKWNWQFTFPVSNDQFYPDIVIGLLLQWVAWSFAVRNR